jgi:hypothetical protein
MPRRASVPEGKSLFFRPAEAVADQSVREYSDEKEPTRQSAIFLEEKQIDWLDDRCKEARRNGGRAIRKAVIIRALLDVAMDSPVDLTGLKEIEDITMRIKKALKGS